MNNCTFQQRQFVTPSLFSSLSILFVSINSYYITPTTTPVDKDEMCNIKEHFLLQMFLEMKVLQTESKTAVLL